MAIMFLTAILYISSKKKTSAYF